MKRALVKSWVTGAGLEAWLFLNGDDVHCGYVSVPGGVTSVDEDQIGLYVDIDFSGSPEWCNNQEVIGYACIGGGDVNFFTQECEKLASYLVSIAGAEKLDIKTR